ncbi:MAG: hypothetical protein MZW92_63505 [Comamonadaceae bacterium]|nr:hypothetical protein [Comamonadaceae bacterium]
MPEQLALGTRLPACRKAHRRSTLDFAYDRSTSDTGAVRHRDVQTDGRRAAGRLSAAGSPRATRSACAYSILGDAARRATTVSAGRPQGWHLWLSGDACSARVPALAAGAVLAHHLGV